MQTDSTTVAPKSSGIVRALWTLASPPNFTPRRADLEGVRYSDRAAGGIAPLADVYLPEGGGPHASVLVIHGGGFVIGSRRMKPVRYLATRLCEAGIATAAIDYRMIFRGGRLAEALADVDAAARWWSGASEAYGIDPHRTAVAGFSAGATLALLAAAASPERFHRIVSFFGVYDFTYLNGRLALWMRQLLLQSRDREVWARHSPLGCCAMPTPLLLLHGTADTLVPIEHARRLRARREELGLPVELVEYPGIPHGFLNDASLPESRAAADAVIRFLEH